ncbi:trypsin-like peptidase domain-containing protein [Candidatus Woesebacteria bacterium]|nr:trypsin-like peptidase domain-containing protein [Candidatus Woesebacteria bacterium]
MSSEQLHTQHSELVEPDFVLTEEVLLAGAEIKEGWVIIPKFVPIEQVAIPWIQAAAKAVCPLTDTNNNPPATIFHFRDNIWVTNHHCIQFQSGRTIEEKLENSVIAANQRLSLKGAKYWPHKVPKFDYRGADDIIVIQTEVSNIPQLNSPTRRIQRGQQLPSVMIGYPYGLPPKKAPYVSFGSETLLYDDSSILGYTRLRWKDGNSGSPVFDTVGNLIGIFSGSFQAIQRVEELVDELR